jgi:hypothetical protein
MKERPMGEDLYISIGTGYYVYYNTGCMSMSIKLYSVVLWWCVIVWVWV